MTHPPHEGHEKKEELKKPRGGQAIAVAGATDWTAAMTGWVVALFTGIILQAVVGAILTGLGNATLNIANVGIALGVVGIIIAFVAFFIGGFTAGKIAGHNGLRQGLMVWTIGVLFLVAMLVLASLVDPGAVVLVGLTVPGTAVASAVAIGVGVILGTELIAALLAGYLSTRGQD